MDDFLQRSRELGNQLRVDSIRCTTAAGSGHPTSSMSAADLMAVLMLKFLKYDWAHPENPNNDRLIFSKGHASPLLYAMDKAVGVITDAELMSLRTFGSRLEGHPKPLQSTTSHGASHGLPWVDVASGSLGQGLPTGVGMARDGKYLDRLPFTVWVLLGDSELAEGSIWEGFDKAHDEALAQTEHPTCIIAKTIKGSGVSLVANKNGWRGKPLSTDQAKAALIELGGKRHITVAVAPIGRRWWCSMARHPTRRSPRNSTPPIRTGSSRSTSRRNSSSRRRSA